jgi:KRAB domain-containing zinc finger protein
VKTHRGRSSLRRLCGKGFSEYSNAEEAWQT